MPKGQHIDRRVITACLLPLVALLALATAWIDAPVPVASPERAVIEAVLASLDVGVPARVAVAPTTPVMSPEWFPEIGAEGAGPQGAAPEAALWHRLARVSAAGRDAGSLALPSRAWVISPTLATAFDARDASWLATFARLRLRLSGNAGVVGLSPVALSADGGSALVYYEYRSGARCGHGTVAWLVRMPDGRWRLRERLPIWES